MRAVLNLTSNRSIPHDQRGHQPIALAYDRRHGDPQVIAEDSNRLHPPRQKLCVVSWPLARYRERRRSAPFSTASTAEQGAAGEREQSGIGTALFLRRNPRPTRHGAAPDLCERAAQAAGGVKSRGGSAAAQCG